MTRGRAAMWAIRLIPILLSLVFWGCFLLAAGSMGYEGYQYSEHKGGLYDATHPKEASAHHASASPTPDIE